MIRSQPGLDEERNTQSVLVFFYFEKDDDNQNNKNVLVCVHLHIHTNVHEHLFFSYKHDCFGLIFYGLVIDAVQASMVLSACSCFCKR